MNNAVKILLALGSGIAIVGTYEDINNKSDNLAKEMSKKLAASLNDDDGLKRAEANLMAYEALSKEVNSAIRNKESELIDWETVNRLKKDADAEFKADLESFKESIGYSKKLDDLGLKKVNGINEGLNGINYVETMKTINNDISYLNDQLDDVDELVDKFKLDDTDTREIRRTAERSIKDKLKKLTKDRDDLIKQKNDIVKSVTKDYNDAVKDLENEVKLKRDELADYCKARKMSIAADVDELKKQAKDIVYDNLSEEDAAFLKKGHEYKQTVDELMGKRDLKAKDIYNKMTTAEKLACYANTKGKSKSDVVMIAAIPAVPVGYVGYKYINFIKDILKKM